jgi:prophage regulatory protein
MNTRKISMHEMQTPGKTLINRKRLLNIIPLSERTILDMEKRGEFPRRFALTPRAVAWDLQEVEAWMDQQKNAGRQCSVPQLKAA